MIIKNPLFIIPTENNRVDKKGGGGAPKYIGDPRGFAEVKRKRVAEVDNLIGLIEDSSSPIQSPGERVFYEVQFHEKALSKSAQPRELFELNNIDIYAQTAENTFLASSSQTNLREFRDAIASLDLKSDKDGSAYLSAITKIKSIPKEDKLIGEIEGDRFEGYLYIADVLSLKEAQSVAKEVKEESSPTEFEFFVSEAGAKLIYGNFSSRFIDEISESNPGIPITTIEKSIRFHTAQNFALEYQMGDVSIEPPELDAKVGVLDTGVQPNAIYDSFIIHKEDFIRNSSEEDFSHGTFVATRAIFGDDIEEQIRDNGILKAKAKVLDIQVMRKDSITTSSREIIKALKSIISNPAYSSVKIFNLSLNNDDWKNTLDRKKSYITRELDALAYNHKVFFVVSAGNQYVYLAKDYPECLFENEALITAPADLINGIAVGSIASADSTRSVARNNEPSPFSRIGLPNTKKPDVVHFGGNCNKSASAAGIGVKAFSIEPGKINEDCGTSHSAPLVSQIAAQIYEYLRTSVPSSAPIIDLTKALLLHSGSYSLPAGSQIDKSELKRITGFGVPDFKGALDCAESSATFIFWDSLGKPAPNQSKKKSKITKITKHKVKFIVPPELEGRGKMVRVKATLVYTPQISPSGHIDYSLVDIECNLHYKNSRGTDTGGALSRIDGDNRLKWTPIKSFERLCSAYKGGEWEVWLTLTTRGAAETDSYLQDYALVISVEDATPNPDDRIELHSIVKAQHRSYVPVGVRVRERARLSTSRI